MRTRSAGKAEGQRPNDRPTSCKSPSAKKRPCSPKAKPPSKKPPPVTPDGHYFLVRGRLWRCSNPALPPIVRQESVNALMNARRAVKTSLARGSSTSLKEARTSVQGAKEALGERGPVWWDAEDGGSWDRYLAKNTPYREWEKGLHCAD